MISNLSFLIKTSVTQLLLVGLGRFPTTALIFLLVVELSYLAFNIISFCKYKHLKSVILLIPKIAQPIALIVTEGYLLYNIFKFEERNWALQEPA